MAFVPDQAIDRSSEISGAAFRLYCYYCKRRNAETGLCWPSLKLSAAELQMAYTYTSEMRKELITEGWIELIEGRQIRCLVGFGNPETRSEKPKPPSEIPNNNSEKPKKVSEFPNPPQANVSVFPKEVSEKPKQSFGNSETHIRKNQPIGPAQLTSPEGETRARAGENVAIDGKVAGPNDDFAGNPDLSPRLNQQELALCQAVGWVVDVLDHRQWMQIKQAGLQIAPHADATPERIARAPDFYWSQNKFSFAPAWIARDWAQIAAWLSAQANGQASESVIVLEQRLKREYAERRSKRT